MDQIADETLTLTAWVFRDPAAAGRLLPRAAASRPAALVGITWPSRRGAPRLVAAVAPAPAVEPTSQALLETVVGTALFLPLPPTSPDASALAGIGVPLRFVNGVRDEVTPGRSAIFVIAADATVDLPGADTGLLSCVLPAAVVGLIRPPG